MANTRPVLSIVMPVFNSGLLLLEAVRSVLAQTLFAAVDDGYWELLIVDDASDDAITRRALVEARAMSPAIDVIPNVRAKGAAGARNTGIFAARGAWIGFLDSDDLWYPDFLSRQQAVFAARPDLRWRAAHFDVGDETASVVARPLSERSPCLYGCVGEDHAAGRLSVLKRPVEVLLRCGCLQVMTVQVERELLQALGGFNETLECAEDYDLWLRLATMNDLAVAPLDAGIYRVRQGSLTKSGKPMYHGEDRMLIAARHEPTFAPFVFEIDERLQKVYSTFCHHFRAARQYETAGRFARRLIQIAPLRAAGWRHLLATVLRR